MSSRSSERPADVQPGAGAGSAAAATAKGVPRLNIRERVCSGLACAMLLSICVTVCGVYSVARSFGPQPYTSPISLPPATRVQSVLPYQICGGSWHGLTVVDLSLLASISYSSGEVLAEDFKSLFGNTDGTSDWDIAYEPTSKAGIDASLFYEFRNKVKNVSVVAMRGVQLRGVTTSEITLWVEALMISVARALIPGVSYLPDEAVLWVLTQLEWMGNSSRDFWGKTLDYVRGLNAQGRSVIVAGHGFGGGIGAVVGALAPAPTFAISSPGLAISRLKYGINPATVMEVVASVIPRRDIVPRIDEQLGLQQTVNCDVLSSWKCHSVFRTTNELIRSCGDARGRGVRDPWNE